MTKADLLRRLQNLPMNAPVVFSDIANGRPTGGGEYVLSHAYTVTGRDGLCLVLTQDPIDLNEYPDAEEVL